MTWYNNFVNKDNYYLFHKDGKHSVGDLTSSFDCLYADELGGEYKIDQNKSNLFRGRLDAAWGIMARLLEIDGVFVDRKCHLQGVEKELSYGACFYIGLRNGKDKENKIINLSVKGRDISVEFRNPVEGNFSADKFLREFKFYGNGRNVGWINGLPAISLKKFFDVDESGIASIYSSDRYEALIKIMGDYIKSIIDFCSEGGSLKICGQSKAEVILLKDIDELFAEKKDDSKKEGWLLHGDRPINNGKRSLELDIQVFLKINNFPVSLAIEVQGRHHYPEINDPQREYVDLKHRRKIEYCKINNMIFIWLDWGALDKCFIKNKVKERGYQERLDIISEFMNKSISAYNAGCRYLEIQKDGNGFVKYSNEYNDKNLFTEYAENYS